MAVIDSDNFITHLVWSGLIDKATCGELKEAIELCTVKDIYTKADMVDMLTEIETEIEEIEIDLPFGFEPVSKTAAFYEGVSASSGIIQQKIKLLKESIDGK